MTRRFAEIVHVGVSGVQPTAFRWRGTRYVVREVLGHWRERRSWWSAPVAQAVLIGSPVEARVGWHTALAEEYEVWRVEAGRRGSEVVGVYDLSHDTGVPPDTGAWRLLRIAD
jgi:hypothetical protein